MTRYQPVKIVFDLDDEYHVKLYNYLKKQTNGSSYIRTLLHLDMIKNTEVMAQSVSPSVPSNEIVKDHILNSEQSTTVDIKPSVSEASVNQTTHHDIRILVNNESIDEDVDISDLI